MFLPDMMPSSNLPTVNLTRTKLLGKDLGCVHTASELAKWRLARRSEAATQRLANTSEFSLIYDHKHGICSLSKFPS